MTRFIEHLTNWKIGAVVHGASQAGFRSPQHRRAVGLRTLCHVEERKKPPAILYWSKVSARVTCKRCRKTIDYAHHLGMRATSFESQEVAQAAQAALLERVETSHDFDRLECERRRIP